MTQYVEIHWTAASIDEARKVARFLVQERHVACAQITPWIESVYMWNNELNTSQESKVVLKTRAEKFSDVRRVIEQNSSYEVPEITMIQIDAGNDDYLSWIAESTPAIASR